MQCCGSGSKGIRIHLAVLDLMIPNGMRIRIEEHGNLPKLTNKPVFLLFKKGFSTVPLDERFFDLLSTISTVGIFFP
jgi:hypothetical protein